MHFDFEPLFTGRRDYLGLLDELRSVTRARDAPLSVAAHKIDPLPELHAAAELLTGEPKWWSRTYFTQVARRVGQIAVMSYDTAMPLESLYGGYVARQTRRERFGVALYVDFAATDEDWAAYREGWGGGGRPAGRGQVTDRE